MCLAALFHCRSACSFCLRKSIALANRGGQPVRCHLVGSFGSGVIKVVEIRTSLPVSGRRFLSWNRLLLQGKEHWEHLDMGVFRREDLYKYIFPWNHFRYCVILIGCTNPFLYVFMVVPLTAKYQLNYCEISKSIQWIFCMQNLRKIELKCVTWRCLCSINSHLQNSHAVVCISGMCKDLTYVS